MFDDLILGNTTMESILKHIPLNLDKPFGEGVMAHVTKQGMKLCDLRNLFDHLFSR